MRSSDCITALRLGLCSVTFRNEPVAAVIDCARRAGIEAIEWTDAHVPAGDLKSARGIGQATRDVGMEPISYGSYAQAGMTNATEFSSVLSTAQVLGARNVRVWTQRGIGSADVSSALRARIVEDLRAIASAGESAGLTISLEFHPKTLTDSLESTIELLCDVRHPNLYTYWQPRPGISQAEATFELESLLPWLTNVHVFNWNARCDRFPLVEGEGFWRPLLERLTRASSSRRRCALIEFVAGDDPAAFDDDARALAGWIR